MNLNLIKRYAYPGDFVLTGTYSKLSIGGIIQSATDSMFSHMLFYVDSPEPNEETEDYTGTIAESTMDFKPYSGTGKRLDNGPQYNDLKNLADVNYGVLVHFKRISNYERQIMLNEIKRIIKSGEYRYDLTGLLGSLITYKLFPFLKKNPFSTGKYCTNFGSEVMRLLGKEYDPSLKYADNNTSPEHVWQWVKSHQSLVEITWV